MSDWLVERSAVFVPGFETPAAARHLLREVLDECQELAWRDAAELALSELATNVILHARTPLTVRIMCSASDLRVEVEDQSAAMPQQRAYGAESTTGRGLALVAALTSDHGFTRTTRGKVVWFCLTKGTDPQEHLEELDVDQLLAAWGDDDLLPAPSGGATVRLLGFPPTLWLAAFEMQDGLLRELELYRSGRGLDTADLGRADQARLHVGTALADALRRDRAGARNPLPGSHPSYFEPVPPAVDLDVPLWPDAAGDCAVMQDVLDEANRLATHNELLMRPALPEVIALRDWVAEQVISAVAGEQPMRWPGADAEHFAQQYDAGVRPVDYDVEAVVRGPRTAICVDSQNRILGISEPLAKEIGWQADDLVGRRVVAIVPPRYREAHVAGLTRHLSTGQEHALRVDLRLPVLHADGREVMYDFWIDVDRSPSGQPVYIAYLCRAATPDGEGVSDKLPAPAVDYVGLFRQLPTSYMVLDRDLRFVDANDAYLSTTGRIREDLVGTYVFDAFPPTLEALGADGVSFVQRSLEHVRDTGRIDTMPLQQYPIAGPDGEMAERWWSLISVPILAADGEVVLVAQRAQDVTDWVRGRANSAAERERSEELTRRVEEVEADLYARARELEVALAAQQEAAARVASLASVAIELTGAETVGDLCRIVFSRGLPVLGADGGIISVRDDERQVVRLTASDDFGSSDLELVHGELPLGSAIPAAYVARTGDQLLLPNRASGLAWNELTTTFYESTGRDAWATVPLRVGERLLGALVVSWVEEREFTPDDLGLIEGFAAQISVALQRIQAKEAERAAAGEAARLSESLQRSLLTDPPQPEDLAIAVRYKPAAQEAQVGGDWYDAFVTEGDATLLVIGDVAGHDRDAAAAMGQIRNLLRGIAYESSDNPATVLSRLDGAVQGLGIQALATAVLARVERGHDRSWQLRWSNAGHPPPLLRLPDGLVHVLADQPDLLLGLDRHAPRSDRVTVLPAGSLLVLYTDGLVEGRAADLDTGIARMADVLRNLQPGTAEEAADALVAAGDATNEDDIAVLVLRVS